MLSYHLSFKSPRSISKSKAKHLPSPANPTPTHAAVPKQHALHPEEGAITEASS